MFKFVKTTNTRPPKDEFASLVVTPSKDTFRLNAVGMAFLGVNVGDYIVVGTAQDEEGNTVYGIAVGREGDEKNAAEGSKLGDHGNFSSAWSWTQYEGLDTHSRIFEIVGSKEEDLELKKEDADAYAEKFTSPDEESGLTWYALAHVKDVEKPVRKKKEGGENGAEEAPAPETAAANAEG